MSNEEASVDHFLNNLSKKRLPVGVTTPEWGVSIQNRISTRISQAPN